MTVPDQWKPENQDPAVAGVRVDVYGRKVDDKTGEPVDETTPKAEEAKQPEPRRTRRTTSE